MENPDQFERFAAGLAVRRRRVEAMARSFQQHAAERMAADDLAWATVFPATRAARVAAHAAAGGDEHLGAVLLAEAAAIVDATVEDLALAEQELVQQSEALFDTRVGMDERGRHFATLFELVPAAYVVTTADGVIREINETGAALLGRPRNFVVGKPLGEFVVAGDERAAFREALGRVGDSSGVEVWCTRVAPAASAPIEVMISVRAVRDDSGGAQPTLYWLLGGAADRDGPGSDDLL